MESKFQELQAKVTALEEENFNLKLENVRLESRLKLLEQNPEKIKIDENLKKKGDKDYHSECIELRGQVKDIMKKLIKMKNDNSILKKKLENESNKRKATEYETKDINTKLIDSQKESLANLFFEDMQNAKDEAEKEKTTRKIIAKCLVRIIKLVDSKMESFTNQINQKMNEMDKKINSSNAKTHKIILERTERT